MSLIILSIYINLQIYQIIKLSNNIMKNITTQTQINPSKHKVKIYFLKNQPQKNKSQHSSISSSLFSLASLIQTNNQQLNFYNNEYPYIDFIQNNQQNQQEQFGQSVNKNHRKINKNNLTRIQQNQNQNFKRNVYTAQLRTLNSFKKTENNLSVPKTSQRPRLMKSHHQKNINNVSMGQNAAKSYLCDIVKEWDGYKLTNKKNILKNKQDDQKSKQIKLNEEQQMKMLENKQLMRRHFNIFEQNQRKSKKQKNKTQTNKLQAIHHREDLQQYQIELSQIKENDNNMKCSTDKNSFRINSVRSSNQNSFILQKDKLKKRQEKEYYSLLEGPQIKLVPFLFNKKYKINNFQWSKIDQKSYSLNKRPSITNTIFNNS